MTGRELIMYILENHLEDKDILSPNNGLSYHIFIREDAAAVECNVGVATIKAWCKQKYLDHVSSGGVIYILKNKKYEDVKRWEEI